MTLIQIDRTLVDTKDVVTISVPDFGVWSGDGWQGTPVTITVTYSNGLRTDMALYPRRFIADRKLVEGDKELIKKAIETYHKALCKAVWRDQPRLIDLPLA